MTHLLRTLAPVLACSSLLAVPGTAQRTALWTVPGLSQSAIDSGIDFFSDPQLAALTPHPRPIFACSLHKMPGDGAGEWTLSFTLRALQGYGNPRFSGFVMARYRPGSAQPITLLHDADAVNGPFVDYNLNLEPITFENGVRTGGRFAVFDRFSAPPTLAYQGVHLAARADDSSPFGAPVPVAGVVGASGFADPALGYVDGSLKLFYAGEVADGQGGVIAGILMDDLLGADSATPSVAGNPVLVTRPTTFAYNHSPSLVHGADGEVGGLFAAEGNATFDRSDIYFSADLDPETPAVLAVENTSWLSSGGTHGGLGFFTQRDNPQSPRRIEGAWLVGGELSASGPAQATVHAWNPPGSATTTAELLLSPQWLPRPVKLTPVVGALGVAPGLRVGPIAVDGDGIAAFDLAAPLSRALVGADVPIQALVERRAPGGQPEWTLTNTATLRVR